MRKGYKLSEKRRSALYNQGYDGFSHQGHREDDEARENTSYEVRNMGRGKPGLTVHHDDQVCTNGPKCEHDRHTAIYRDHKGTPVAYAAYHPMWGKQRVSLLYADRTRGITHALAVGHIAHHLDKVGVEPSSALTHHSQTLVSHGFEMKEQGRDAKIKQYLDKRNARIEKGYEMSEDRRRALAGRGLGGFARRAPADPTGIDARDWHSTIRAQGHGKPGLSITHRWGDECEHKGVGCDTEDHSLVHRDSQGAPVAYAKVEPDYYEEHGGKAFVSRLASDRTRGVAHALAVGHIARHLDKMGVEPSSDLSTYSQRFISHGFEMKETGRDAKLKNYLARRSARVPTQQRLFEKGYQLTPEGGERARRFAGAGPSDMYKPDEWAQDELSIIPKGKPGLSIHRHQTASAPWNWGPHAKMSHATGTHTLVYRDKAGTPVTAATVDSLGIDHSINRHNGEVTFRLNRLRGGRKVGQMVSDRSRGSLHALGTAHVGRALTKLKVNQTGSMTEHSQRMVAHTLDQPEKTKKIMDYIAKRGARVQKGLFHATESPKIHIEYKERENRGIHAGTVRAALDRAKVHCNWHYNSNDEHEHYIARVSPKFRAVTGSFKEPTKDEGAFWNDEPSKVYRNDFEHPGSRSVYAAKPGEAKVKPPIQIPHQLVYKHGNGACPPRCVHERALTKFIRAQS